MPWSLNHLQPIQAPKQGQLCLIKGKTQDNSWSGAWPCGKPTASSVVVFEAQHLEILGGTSSKVGKILLTKKHLELLGEHQLKKRPCIIGLCEKPAGHTFSLNSRGKVDFNPLKFGMQFKWELP